MDARFFPVLGLVTLLSFAIAEGRTWVNSSGHPIEGSFVDLSRGIVKIRLDADAKVGSVPLNILSKADQEFVRDRVHQ